MKKVSIIVPIYNVEKYIAQCLLSIKEQTLSDFECLLINDGTKDDSMKIAKESVQGDERFLFFDKENGGLSDARNFGLDRIKGEYVCFVDSDDYIAKDMLEKAYACAKKYDSDICCFDLSYEYSDHSEYSSGADFEVNSFEKDKDILFINNSSNNKLYRSSFMKDKRFIKGMWYEDLAVVPLWIAKANNVSHVNEALYYYIQREGSISHSEDKRIFDIYKAIANIRKELSLSAREVRKLYFDNCLVMTTLRIKELEKEESRLVYYRENIEKLTEAYPFWYEDVQKEDYNKKQKIIFFLLKKKYYRIVDKIYHR